MMVYLDASALVKHYIVEAGTAEVRRLIADTALNGTALISRAEVSAAFSKAARVGTVTRDEAAMLMTLFRQHWANLLRVKVDEAAVARADALAWEHGLRDYDAVHLACALIWQESAREPVTLATFDEQLWTAAQKVGLTVWPEALE